MPNVREELNGHMGSTGLVCADGLQPLDERCVPVHDIQSNLRDTLERSASSRHGEPEYPTD